MPFLFWYLSWLFWSSCALATLGYAAFAHAQVTTPSNWSVGPTGAYQHEIPLRLPPGVAGVAPKINLHYNSHQGNGLLGVGWSLSGLSAITRCAPNRHIDGVQGSVQMNANDKLCLANTPAKAATPWAR